MQQLQLRRKFPVKVLRNCSSIPRTSCLRMAYANNTPIMNDPKMFINRVNDWNELKKRSPCIMSLPINSPLFIKLSAKMMRAVAPTRKINFMRKPKRIALSSRSSKDADSWIALGSILYSATVEKRRKSVVIGTRIGWSGPRFWLPMDTWTSALLGRLC